MKRNCIVNVLVMAILIAPFAACGGSLAKKLDGTTWTGQRLDPDGVTVGFELNLLSGSDRCTFKITANGNVSNYSGTYTVSGSTLTLVLDKITENTQFVVSGNQMTSESGDAKIVLKKKTF
ncbi:MAG: META domain-containing protein [Tannerella sp.]|nr:META domain-containing protein [Tannerella sp.]